MTLEFLLKLTLGLLLLSLQLDGSACLLHVSPFLVRQTTKIDWIVPPLPRGSAKRVSFTRLSVSLTPNQLDGARSFENADSAAGSRPSRYGSNASKQGQGSDKTSGDAANFLIDSGNVSINLPLLRSVCSSQIFMLVVAVSLFVALGGDHNTLPSLELPSTGPSLNSLPTSVLAGSTLSLSLCFYEWTSHASYRPASQLNFATSHLVFDLFGRRPRQIQHQPVSSEHGSPFVASSMVDMFATILIIGLVSFVTAFCQELSFRGFFCEIVSKQLSILGPMPFAASAAVVVQAAVYAALTTPSVDASSSKVDFLSLTYKFTAGLLLGILAGTSHSLLPGVAVQFLSTWHVMSKSWVHVNHHMDWVERQVLPAVSYDHSTVRIPNDIRWSLFRFSCAFDIEEQESLSLSDCQRAVSFAFWHSENPPSQEEVRQAVLSQEGSRSGDHPHMPDDYTSESVRINFDEFVDVLVALKRRAA